MTLFLLLILSLLGTTESTDTGRSHPDPRDCPAVHPDAEARIRNLLTTPLLPQLRARYDLGTASADDIQPLTSEADLATCQALWNALEAADTDLAASDQVSFFRSGNRFFVPIVRGRPLPAGVVIRLDGYSSLDVYDAGYRLIARFGA